MTAKYNPAPTFTYRPTSIVGGKMTPGQDHTVVILSRLDQEPDELEEVGSMYLVARVSDGHVGHAFEDELTPDDATPAPRGDVHLPDDFNPNYTAGTRCGLMFGGKGWDADRDSVITEPQEVDDVTCEDCQDELTVAEAKRLKRKRV